MKATLPRGSTLWRGAILGGIANATTTARSRTYAAFQRWCCNNYVVNSGSGEEGVVSFAGGHWYPEGPLVAVLDDVHVRRLVRKSKGDVEAFFRGCPPYQRALADSGLCYLRLVSRGRTIQR